MMVGEDLLPTRMASFLPGGMVHTIFFNFGDSFNPFERMEIDLWWFIDTGVAGLDGQSKSLQMHIGGR